MIALPWSFLFVFYFLAVVVQLLPSISFVVIVQAQQSSPCNQCQFDGNDATDCKDYGKLDSTRLKAWSLGSDECKGVWNLVISSVDPTTSCNSANAFVNAIQFGSLSSSTTRLGLGVGSGDDASFFVQDDTNNNAVVLAPSIQINGITIDCTTSSSDCYNAMKDYFANNAAGIQEQDDVCQQLFNKVKNDKQLEESTLRLRLCKESREEGTTIPDECQPLWSEVEAEMMDNPDRPCNGYASGVGTTVIPGCEDVNGGNGSGNGSGGGSSTGVIMSQKGTALFVWMTAMGSCFWI